MLDKLYNMAYSIPEELEFVNKYTWLLVNNILDGRYLDVNDAMKNRDIKINSYITHNEAVLLFPNKVGGKIVDLYIMPLYKKDAPLKLGSVDFPYNIGNLNLDFKYGDVIILVEGIADLAALKLINDKYNVISMQSSKLSDKHISFLSSITNRFIILHDNDWAGRQGFNKMRYRFSKLGCNITSINQYNSYKDTGDLLDEILNYYNTKNDSILNNIEIAQKYYLTAIKTEIKSI